MLNPRQARTIRRAGRLGLYQSSLGHTALAPAARFRSQRVAPAVTRQAQQNKQASVVNRNPYALLGMRILARRRR
jgi:hypothetical protein